MLLRARHEPIAAVRRPTLRRAAVAVGLALMAAAVGLRWLAIEREVVLQPYNIEAANGDGFAYDLDAPTLPFALHAQRDGSLMRLSEDGRPLIALPRRGEGAPPASLGHGSHDYRNGASLRFKATDGSDPRTNGRFYHAAYVIVLAPGALQLLLTAGAALAAAALPGFGRGSETARGPALRAPGADRENG